MRSKHEGCAPSSWRTSRQAIVSALVCSSCGPQQLPIDPDLCPCKLHTWVPYPFSAPYYGDSGDKVDAQSRHRIDPGFAPLQAAQEKIQEAVAETPTSRNFEATAGVYEAVYNADTAVLKVKTLSQCLSKMQALFSAAASSAPGPPAGAGEGSDSVAEPEAAGASPTEAGESPTEAATAPATDDEPMADAEAAGTEQQHPPPGTSLLVNAPAVAEPWPGTDALRLQMRQTVQSRWTLRRRSCAQAG
jgi:hypothetical protein